MNCDYADIRGKISEPPQWFDEYAVPRYAAFAPQRAANIYADECALVEISCQNCGTRFRVAFSRSKSGAHLEANRHGGEPISLAQTIRGKTIHYGDPPNIGCCPSGPTMNSGPLHVLEFWHRPERKWERDPELEIDVSDDVPSAHAANTP